MDSGQQRDGTLTARHARKRHQRYTYRLPLLPILIPQAPRRSVSTEEMQSRFLEPFSRKAQVSGQPKWFSEPVWTGNVPSNYPSANFWPRRRTHVSRPAARYAAHPPRPIDVVGERNNNPVKLREWLWFRLVGARVLDQYHWEVSEEQ